MKRSSKSMTVFAQNPFIYVFSILVIVAMAVYFGYIAIDRIGLQTESRTATVLNKQIVAAREAPYVNIVAGRPWVQSQEIPELRVLTLRWDNTDLYASVDQAVFDAVNTGDSVGIFIQRRRLSGAVIVVDVIPQGD